MSSHSQNKFSEIVQHGLVAGGIHTVASKNHGKSRLLFSMARELREKSRVLIFDGSETWLYAFDRIPVLTISEKDIQLVSHNHTTEDIERYEIQNMALVKQALEGYKDILFRLKTRKPSKRGYFVRTVINLLDAQQREIRTQTLDNEATQYLAYFIEEAQDCFNSRSTTRLETEEFLTVFNEARNQKEAFFTASQRLNDFSKTIRTKQLYCVGKIASEDLTVFLRRLEREHNLDFSKMPSRTWFLEGETFESPEWKQRGKPYQINRELRQTQQPDKPKKPSLLRRFARAWLDMANTLGVGYRVEQPQPRTEQTEQPDLDEKEFCAICGRELDDSNRGTTDRELCFECEHDRADEENMEMI